MNRSSLALGSLIMMSLSACMSSKKSGPTFAEDLAFLMKHVDVVVLSDDKGSAQVALVPAYQGRVMTSTASGGKGASFGWVNRELISSDKKDPHINAFGGEDRFWIGPEGGQFSIFFAKGASFDLDHWFTPVPIDTEPFGLIAKSRDQAIFRSKFQLTNFSGTTFEVDVRREIRLRDAGELLKGLGSSLPAGVDAVAFESVNSITNAGSQPWKKESGLLSVWILGMLNASPTTTVVIPFEPGSESEKGPVVNDVYFGKVPADRLHVKDGVLFFRGDAACRSKIGVPPRRAKPVLGSWDAASGALTLVVFTLPKDTTDYVNSLWKIQEDPYGGDVVNSYNDGSAKPGAKPLGQFYELETSSPALALGAGVAATHTHITMHLQGTRDELDAIAWKVLGVSIEEIEQAFGR